MKTYAILRRNAWKTPQDLEASASLSARVGNEEMPNDVRWIRSYVIEDANGTLGTLCIYQGRDDEAIREHARRAKLRADEVLPVRDCVVVRPDPASYRGE